MEKREAHARIEKLKQEIEKHRTAYHVYDTETISEGALDSLKKELFELELAFPEYVTPDSPTQRIGGKPLEKFVKVKHVVPMISFFDAFSEEDMIAWLERLENYLGKSVLDKKDIWSPFYCELKIDGLAIELVYRNGEFIQASTRGNGIIGEDVTQNLKTVEAIPLKLYSKEIVEKNLRDAGLRPGMYETEPEELIVRGEVFLTKKEFHRINKEQEKLGLKLYANPRNVAAGSVRQLDPKVTASRKLDSYQYALVTNIGQTHHEEEHMLLKAFGFKTNPSNEPAKNLHDIFAFRKKWEEKKEELAYEIDGTVVLVNKNATYEEAGTVGKAPRGGIAYKFSPKEATTKIQNIIVQVGRTGALTPVAELEPVQVGGVTISHATLHNFDEIERLGVRIGDTVIVSRAGDVIPKITEVLTSLRTGKEKKFRIPDVCPIDGSHIVHEGSVWRCSNKRCGARVRESLYHFVSRGAFDMRGLGPKIIDRFLDEGLITDSADIFSVHEGDIAVLERFGEKSAQNIMNEIHEKRTISLPRFLYSLGILHVGEETARALARFIEESRKKDGKEVQISEIQACILKTGKEGLEMIPDVGPKVSESIHEWFTDSRNEKLLKKFEEGALHIVKSETPISQKLKGMVFVLTGTLAHMERSDAKESIRRLGGIISENVSKKTSYVIVGVNPGSKYEKAKELGVPMLTEERFQELLES